HHGCRHGRHGARGRRRPGRTLPAVASVGEAVRGAALRVEARRQAVLLAARRRPRVRQPVHLRRAGVELRALRALRRVRARAVTQAARFPRAPQAQLRSPVRALRRVSRRVRAAPHAGGARHRLAHVPCPAPVRQRRAAGALPAAHGGQRHRHQNGLDGQRAASARVQGSTPSRAARRLAACGCRHGAGADPAVSSRDGRCRRRLPVRHRRCVPRGAPLMERYTLISADCHAGGNMEMYREHLDPAYVDEVERWLGAYSNPFRDLQRGGRTRNWDNERRIRAQESDGVVAEVVFPNTVLAFFPTGALVARPPRPEELELRLAGIRAHNRWLAAWCAEHGARRAGIAQLFLNDVDEAIADVRFAHAHGLRGGVLLPAVPPDVDWIKPLYAPDFDPLWAVCEELDVVVNHHSGGGSPDYGPYPVAGVLWIAETTFFSRRALTHLILGGVFERFPGLRFVVTEQGASWIPPLLAKLYGFDLEARAPIAARVGPRLDELATPLDAIPSGATSPAFFRP